MSFIDRFLNAIKLNDDFDEDDDFLDDDEEPERKEKKKKPAKSDRSGKSERFFTRFDEDEDEDDEDFDEDFDDDEERTSRRSSGSSGSSSGRNRRARDTSGRDYSSGRTYRDSSSERSYSSSRGGSGDRYTDSGYSRTGDSGRRVTYGARTDSRHDDRRAEDRKASKKTSSNRKKNAPVTPEVNVVRPSSMEDAWQIADTLIDRSMVVLNLEGLDVDVAQRVVDFSCGVCYSLKAQIKKISSYIFLLTPEGVDTSGDYQSILEGTFDIPSMRGVY